MVQNPTPAHSVFQQTETATRLGTAFCCLLAFLGGLGLRVCSFVKGISIIVVVCFLVSGRAGI